MALVFFLWGRGIFLGEDVEGGSSKVEVCLGN